MRIRLLFGALLVLLALGALPIADAQVGRRIYLPLLARDSTPTPQPTATPVPVQDVHVRYRAYAQDYGWLAFQGEGGQAGTTGEARRIEAFSFEITSGPPGVTIKYRAHMQDFGWQDYVTNGGIAGSPGSGKQVEAMQVGLENAPPNTYISLEPYLADWGYVGYVRDFWIAGSVGQQRRIEAFHAYVRNRQGPEPARVGVAYNANPRGLGYTGWVRNGDQAGTTGQSKPLNTFKAVLYNFPENMKLEYRCYVQDNDWQPWTDGECGRFSDDKDIYATEMRLINAYPGSVLSYTLHVANRGDITYSTDNPSSNGGQGPIVGNPSEKARVEAIRIGIGSALPLAR
jgi:uncharacterized protein YjdB